MQKIAPAVSSVHSVNGQNSHDPAANALSTPYYINNSYRIHAKQCTPVSCQPVIIRISGANTMSRVVVFCANLRKVEFVVPTSYISLAGHISNFAQICAHVCQSCWQPSSPSIHTDTCRRVVLLCASSYCSDGGRPLLRRPPRVPRVPPSP